MEIEHVAGIGFTAGGAAQQQGQGPVGHRVLGQIIIDISTSLPWAMKYSAMATPE